jgi:hypothetical protein
MEKQKKTKHIAERGSVTARLAHLENEVEGLKRELAAERLDALKRDVAAAIEQADRGETEPFDIEYYRGIITAACHRKAAS